MTVIHLIPTFNLHSVLSFLYTWEPEGKQWIITIGQGAVAWIETYAAGLNGIMHCKDTNHLGCLRYIGFFFFFFSTSITAPQVEENSDWSAGDNYIPRLELDAQLTF